MQIGVTFPQNEITADPSAVRDYVQSAEEFGYRHLIIYDHVLGADPANRPGWQGYTHQSLFHEPFVLFGYLAAISRLELATAVIILPQRQTVLVAKQAAEVDILSGGKFRLGVGVGWNPVEYEGLNMDFHTRGRVLDEQIDVLRRLWSQEVITYKGKFHTISEAGLNPLPVRRSIPIWTGGSSEAALRRTARLADGWFPLGQPDEKMRATVEHLRGYIGEAGRDPATFGIEARVNYSDGGPDEWKRQVAAWRELGATHISVNTMNAGLNSPAEHITALLRFKEAVDG
jgi:probable F420-dependent oxidoreductase